MWQGDTMVSVKCDITLYAFPSDHHDCFICFCSKIYDKSELELVWLYSDQTVESFIENKEWKVKVLPKPAKENHCNKRFQEKYSCLTIQFALKRKAIAYHVTFFVPCVYLSLIMALLFFVPIETGERLNLIVTALLTIVVFQQLTLDIIPPYSLPLLSQYYFFSLTLAFFSAIIGIIITNIYYRPGRCLPEKLHTVLIEWLGRLVFRTRNYYNFVTGEYDIEHNDGQTDFNQLQNSQQTEDGSQNEVPCNPSSDSLSTSEVRISNVLPASVNSLQKRKKTEAIQLLIEEQKRLYSMDDFKKEADKIEKSIKEQVNKYQIYQLVRVLDRLFLWISLLSVFFFIICYSICISI